MWSFHHVKIFRFYFLVSVRKLLKLVTKYLKSLVSDDKLVFCLLKLAIAFQPLQVVLSRTPLVEVEGVEVVGEVVRCV